MDKRMDKNRKIEIIRWTTLACLVLLTLALVNYSFFRTCAEDYNPCVVCSNAGYVVTNPGVAAPMGVDELQSLNISLNTDNDRGG